MTIRLKKNTQGLPDADPATHLANLYCDVCGASMANVNLDTVANYTTNEGGVRLCISIKDSDIGGTCNNATLWPLLNGTDDAKAIVAAKTS